MEVDYTKKAIVRVSDAKIVATLYLSLAAKSEEELEARAAELLDFILYHGRDDGMVGWDSNTLPYEKDGDIFFTSIEAKTAFRNLADLTFTACMLSSSLISISIEKNVNLQHSEIEESIMIAQEACGAYKAMFSEKVKERIKRTQIMRNALGIPNPRPMVHHERGEEKGD